MLRRMMMLPALALIACGECPTPASRLASLPDTYPIRSSCYGLSPDLKAAIPVKPDDTSDIRLCANVQKDGHMGLDLRYRPEQVGPVTFAKVTLRDAQGKSSSEIFPMPVNPVSGGYELYLSDGCVLGSFGGCSVPAPKKMSGLFETLKMDERQKMGSFYVDLSFVSLKGEGKMNWDLHDTLTKKEYSFLISAF